MEPEVEARFQRIEADLAAAARQNREAMARLDLEEERAKREEVREEARAKREEARLAKNHEAAMERMEKFDRQLQATRKLVEAGMKIVSRLAVDAREARKETRELKAEFRSYLRAQKNGHNGSNGRSH